MCCFFFSGLKHVGKKIISKQREKEIVSYLLNPFPIRKYASGLYAWQARVHILAHFSLCNFNSLPALQATLAAVCVPDSFDYKSQSLQWGRKLCGDGYYLVSLAPFPSQVRWVKRGYGIDGEGKIMVVLLVAPSAS